MNILFNPEADRVFCILDAPDKDAVDKSHQKLGIKCEWIMEVKRNSSLVLMLLIDFYKIDCGKILWTLWTRTCRDNNIILLSLLTHNLTIPFLIY